MITRGLEEQASHPLLLQIGIINNSSLSDIALRLDRGTTDRIEIPKRVFKVVPEAKQWGIEYWDGIPARPFLEQTLDTYYEEWISLFRENFKPFFNNGERVLHILGKQAVLDMQRVIGTANWHPNSEIWRLYKERTGTNESPLMYKKRLYNSISYQVVKV